MKTIIKPDHPQERLARLGAHSLSTTEILSLVICDSSSSASLTRRLLVKFHSLQALARRTPRELASLKGFSLDKAARLIAAFELGRRITSERFVRHPVDNPEVVCQLVAEDLRGLSKERLQVLLLDTKYQLLCIEEIALGSLNETIAEPREIFRPAMIHSAYAIIVVHNHPSGDPTPSDTDKKLTRRLEEVSKILGVKLADHIIIGNFLADRESYFSFRENKLLS